MKIGNYIASILVPAKCRDSWGRRMRQGVIVFSEEKNKFSIMSVVALYSESNVPSGCVAFATSKQDAIRAIERLDAKTSSINRHVGWEKNPGRCNRLTRHR